MLWLIGILVAAGYLVVFALMFAAKRGDEISERAHRELATRRWLEDLTEDETRDE